MDIFLRKLSHKAFENKKTAYQNNFCKYINQPILLFISSLHISAIVSLFLGLMLINRWGRKPVLIIGSFLLCVGVGLTTWFHSVPMGTIGRITLGLGVGFAFQAISMILSETAPEETRGKFDKLFQYQIYAGMLLAPIMNYIASSYVWGWRLSFGVAGIPAMMLFLASLAVRETPTFLIQHGELTNAEETLMNIRGTDVEVEFTELCKAIERSQVNNPVKELLKRPSRPALVITTMAQVLQPLLGITVFVNYGSLLFQSLNYTSHVAFLMPVVIGILGMPFTFMTPFISELIGRRMLYLVACGASFFSQIVTWEILFFDMDPNYYLKRYVDYTVLSMVVIFVAANAILTGPYGWLSATFPEKTIVLGSVWEVGLFMTMNVLTVQVLSHLYCSFHEWIFFCFAACDIITGCFIFFLLPETTGVKKHELTRKVWNRHQFWKRYTLDGEDSDS